MADHWGRNDDREGGLQEVPGAAQSCSPGELARLLICGAAAPGWVATTFIKNIPRIPGTFLHPNPGFE